MEQQIESGETYIIFQPVTQQIVIDPNSRSVRFFFIFETYLKNKFLWTDCKHNDGSNFITKLWCASNVRIIHIQFTPRSIRTGYY